MLKPAKPEMVYKLFFIFFRVKLLTFASRKTTVDRQGGPDPVPGPSPGTFHGFCINSLKWFK